MRASTSAIVVIILASPAVAYPCSESLGVQHYVPLSNQSPANARLIVELAHPPSDPAFDFALDFGSGKPMPLVDSASTVLLYDISEHLDQDPVEVGWYTIGDIPKPRGPLDLEPPSEVPTGLSAENQNGLGCNDSLRLTVIHGLPEPEGDTVGYFLYRHGETTAIGGTTTGEILADRDRDASDGCYEVRAFDVAGNLGPLSEAICTGCTCTGGPGENLWFIGAMLGALGVRSWRNRD